MKVDYARKVFLPIECGSWLYGVNCSQSCTGHCRDNRTCNHVTGQCDRECEAGWTGALCVRGNFTYCKGFDYFIINVDDKTYSLKK